MPFQGSRFEPASLLPHSTEHNVIDLFMPIPAPNPIKFNSWAKYVKI
jgi:hypothetical protein